MLRANSLEPLAEVEGALLVVQVLHLPHPKLLGLLHVGEHLHEHSPHSQAPKPGAVRPHALHRHTTPVSRRLFSSASPQAAAQVGSYALPRICHGLSALLPPALVFWLRAEARYYHPPSCAALPPQPSAMHVPLSSVLTFLSENGFRWEEGKGRRGARKQTPMGVTETARAKTPHAHLP